MQDFWTKRRDDTTDHVSELINIKFRAAVLKAVRELISEEITEQDMQQWREQRAEAEREADDEQPEHRGIVSEENSERRS